MISFKKYSVFNEESVGISDPFSEGDYVWSRTLKIHNLAVIKIIASVTGEGVNHKATISVITNSLDDLAKAKGEEKIIIHEKNFDNLKDATSHLIEKEKETTFV